MSLLRKSLTCRIEPFFRSFGLVVFLIYLIIDIPIRVRLFFAVPNTFRSRTTATRTLHWITPMVIIVSTRTSGLGDLHQTLLTCSICTRRDTMKKTHNLHAVLAFGYPPVNWFDRVFKPADVSCLDVVISGCWSFLVVSNGYHRSHHHARGESPMPTRQPKNHQGPPLCRSSGRLPVRRPKVVGGRCQIWIPSARPVPATRTKHTLAFRI